MRRLLVTIAAAAVAFLGVAGLPGPASAHSGADQVGVNQTAGCFYNPLVDITVSGYNQSGQRVTGKWSKSPTKVCTLITDNWWWQTSRGITVTARFMGTPGVTPEVTRTCTYYIDDGWYQTWVKTAWANISPSSCS